MQQQLPEDKMVSRKQIVTVFLIAFTVVVMLFFLTSDYHFNFSFSADNSHPLKLQRGYTTPPSKFFGHQDIEDSVYEGEDGEVVPGEDGQLGDGEVVRGTFTPAAFTTAPPVVTHTTGDDITKEMMRDVLAGDVEEAPDTLIAPEEGMREFTKTVPPGGEVPQVEINHSEKESVLKSTTSDTTTTEIRTTMQTTVTTTPTEAPSTSSFFSSPKGGNNPKFVAKRYIRNMIQTTGQTETSEHTSVTLTEQVVTQPVPATDAVSSTNTSVLETASTGKQTLIARSDSSKAVTSSTVTSSTVTFEVPVSEAPTTENVAAVNTTSSSSQRSNSSEEKSQEGNSIHENEVLSHEDQDKVVVMDRSEEFQSDETNETLNF